MAIKNYSVNITKDTEDVDYKPTDIKQSFKDLDINKLDLANLENKDNLDPTEIIHPINILIEKNKPTVDIYTESPIEIIEPNTHEFDIYQSSHNIPTTLIDTHHHTTDDEDIPTHKIKYEESEEIKVIPKIKTDSERRDDIIYEFVKLKAKYGKTDHIEIPKFTENLSEIESRYKII